MLDDWERLKSLTERLQHLNLQERIQDIQLVPMKNIGGSCDILSGTYDLRGRKVKIAIKRLRFFISKEEEFAKVCRAWHWQGLNIIVVLIIN